jgi:hypothetical protein
MLTLRPLVNVLGPGTYPVQPLYVRELACYVVAMLDNPRGEPDAGDRRAADHSCYAQDARSAGSARPSNPYAAADHAPGRAADR